MMCQRIGWPPISTIGLGFTPVSSARRVPRPPARMTTFMPTCLSHRFGVSPLRCWAASRYLPPVRIVDVARDLARGDAGAFHDQDRRPLLEVVVTLNLMIP